MGLPGHIAAQQLAIESKMTNLPIRQYGRVVPFTKGTIDSKLQALGSAGTAKFRSKIPMELPVHRIPAGEGTVPETISAMMLEERNNITEANLPGQLGIVDGTVMTVAQEINEVVVRDVSSPSLIVIVAQ